MNTSISEVKIETCIFNASGCWCTSQKELDELKESEAGAIVSKSSTLSEREGNIKPRLHLNDLLTINSMGAPNLGYKFYTNYGQNLSQKPLIQSILPFNMKEMKTMLYDINQCKTFEDNLIELNLSCPNLEKKSIVAYDFESLEKYLNDLNQYSLKKLKIGLKLPPYFELRTFEQVSRLIQKYDNNVNFITCINSLPNGLIVNIDTCSTQIKPNQGFGGIGGSCCLPIALANVKRFYDLLGDKIEIIGCGGISKGEHIFQHILAGASAVEVGSQLVREGPDCFSRLKQELQFIMKQKKFNHIHDFKGFLNN